jgi:hypothetical protein
MARYTGEVAKEYVGDKDLAMQYTSVARTLLGSLHEMSGGIESGIRRVLLPDGAAITVSFAGALEKISIDVRSVTVPSIQVGTYGFVYTPGTYLSNGTDYMDIGRMPYRVYPTLRHYEDSGLGVFSKVVDNVGIRPHVQVSTTGERTYTSYSSQLRAHPYPSDVWQGQRDYMYTSLPVLHKGSAYHLQYAFWQVDPGNLNVRTLSGAPVEGRYGFNYQGIIGEGSRYQYHTNYLDQIWVMQDGIPCDTLLRSYFLENGDSRFTFAQPSIIGFFKNDAYLLISLHTRKIYPLNIFDYWYEYEYLWWVWPRNNSDSPTCLGGYSEFVYVNTTIPIKSPYKVKPGTYTGVHFTPFAKGPVYGDTSWSRRLAFYAISTDETGAPTLDLTFVDAYDTPLADFMGYSETSYLDYYFDSTAKTWGIVYAGSVYEGGIRHAMIYKEDTLVEKRPETMILLGFNYDNYVFVGGPNQDGLIYEMNGAEIGPGSYFDMIGGYAALKEGLPQVSGPMYSLNGKVSSLVVLDLIQQQYPADLARIVSGYTGFGIVGGVTDGVVSAG